MTTGNVELITSKMCSKQLVLLLAACFLLAFESTVFYLTITSVSHDPKHIKTLVLITVGLYNTKLVSFPWWQRKLRFFLMFVIYYEGGSKSKPGPDITVTIWPWLNICMPLNQSWNIWKWVLRGFVHRCAVCSHHIYIWYYDIHDIHDITAFYFYVNEWGVWLVSLQQQWNMLFFF